MNFLKKTALAAKENPIQAVVAVFLLLITLIAFNARNQLKDREGPVRLLEGGGTGIKIRFSMPMSAVVEKVFHQLVRAFERKHPGIDMVVQPAPGGRNFSSVIGTLMAGRKAPDVIFFEDEPFAEFASAQAFLPLDAYIERDDYDVEDFFKVPQSEFVYKGTTFGFSQGWGANLLLYNKDLFDERGVTYSDEWVWDDFVKACEQLTFDRDGDGDTDVYGFDGHRNFHHALIAIWSTGAPCPRTVFRNPTCAF